MSNQEDDRFVREVSEELRKERMQNLWKNFGPFVIAAAVGIVVVTASFQFYAYYSENLSAQNGDKFNEALSLLDEGKDAEGLSALDEIATQGTPAYATLAKLRAANVKAEQDVAGAVKEFKEIAQNGDTPDFLQDFADLRAGQLMVDVASFDEVVAQLQSLDSQTNAYRFSAREAMALAAYKAGDLKETKTRMEALVNDPLTSSAIVQRANIILELIASTGQAAQ